MSVPVVEAYTPKEIAAMLRVDARTVLAWIHYGEIEAEDMSSRRSSKKPSWRITADALERFRQSRSSLNRADRPMRPRRKQVPTTDYFPE